MQALKRLTNNSNLLHPWAHFINYALVETRPFHPLPPPLPPGVRSTRGNFFPFASPVITRMVSSIDNIASL